MALQRYSRMRPRSKKRAQREREYRKLRAAFLAENVWCWFPGCGRRSQDVHHKRGRVGELLTAVEHFAALCRVHHDYVGAHPTEAKDVLRLSESRLT